MDTVFTFTQNEIISTSYPYILLPWYDIVIQILRLRY